LLKWETQFVPSEEREAMATPEVQNV
jgi:hypothetical protein